MSISTSIRTAPAKCPFLAYQGEDVDVLLTIYDVDGNLVDLTGYTVQATVSDSSGVVQFNLSSATSGVTIATQSGATLGQATVNFSNSDLGALAEGNYTWDAWVTDPATKNRTVVAPSRINIEPAPTVP